MHPSAAAETQAWLRFPVACGYLTDEIVEELYETYDRILGKLVRMIINPSPWVLPISNR